MKDYFEQLIERVRQNDNLVIYKQEISKKPVGLNDNVILGFPISDKVKQIYSTYEKFHLRWKSNASKLYGVVEFIPYDKLTYWHEDIVGIMTDIYDVEKDELNIREDIENWYPIFNFPNGDSFCLDVRNGKIVLYDYELYDGVNINGLVIASSIDELFEKWSQCCFIDFYDWHKVVNENGLDLDNELLKDAKELCI